MGERKLSAAQAAAVAHRDGPAMVLAGPGSGKTFVITSRVKALIESGIRPENILVITFTRAAAEEMRERFRKMTAPRQLRVTFGTFHSVFFLILKYAYHYTADSILRDEERVEILRQIAEKLGIDADDTREWAAGVTAEISLVKTEQIPLEHYYSAVCAEEDFRKIFRLYREEMDRRHKIDFDDMCVYCLDLFRARKDILAQWSDRFSYILIDEFQDINPLQYKIVRLLAEPRNNLFIVGDDDQSIYRFRGSRPELMLNFPKDYPTAKTFELSQNYRSSGNIVHAATLVIDQNEVRFKKNLFTNAEAGDPVEVLECRDSATELLYLARQIRQAKEAGRSLSSIAVLSRTNIGIRAPAEKLSEFSLPFSAKDTIPNVYDHWIAEDLLAYLRLGEAHDAGSIPGGREPGKAAAVSSFGADLMRVCNRPNRYISRLAVDSAVRGGWDGIMNFYGDKQWMRERVGRLQADLRMIGKLRPFAAINYIRKGIGYDAYLTDYAMKRRMQPDDLLEVADELQESSAEYATFGEWLSHIEAFRREMEERKRSNKSSGVDSKEGAVTLATLHASKGLEFDEVFILDCNENVIPYKKASLETDIEEERRLFYVGMTRAKKKLHILYVKEKYNKVLEPSRFLDALR